MITRIGFLPQEVRPVPTWSEKPPEEGRNSLQDALPRDFLVEGEPREFPPGGKEPRTAGVGTGMRIVESRLDAVARGLAGGMSRREALRAGGVAVAGVLTRSPADALAKKKAKCPKHHISCAREVLSGRRGLPGAEAQERQAHVRLPARREPVLGQVHERLQRPEQLRSLRPRLRYGPDMQQRQLRVQRRSPHVQRDLCRPVLRRVRLR